jgi:transposase-like protein
MSPDRPHVTGSPPGWGDVWTWTAIDADTKLCVTYFVGDRGKHSAFAFMDDAAKRIKGRLQITTDAHRPYLAAVEKAFGGEMPTTRRSTSCTALLASLRRATAPLLASGAT